MRVLASYNTLCLVDDYSANTTAQEVPSSTMHVIHAVWLFEVYWSVLLQCPNPSHGVPACSNKALLTTLLRDQWNFDGYVVGDAGAVRFEVSPTLFAQWPPELASVCSKLITSTWTPNRQQQLSHCWPELTLLLEAAVQMAPPIATAWARTRPPVSTANNRPADGRASPYLRSLAILVFCKCH